MVSIWFGHTNIHTFIERIAAKTNNQNQWPIRQYWKFHTYIFAHVGMERHAAVFLFLHPIAELLKPNFRILFVLKSIENLLIGIYAFNNVIYAFVQDSGRAGAAEKFIRTPLWQTLNTSKFGVRFSLRSFSVLQQCLEELGSSRRRIIILTNVFYRDVNNFVIG